jgi:hypothetical protein
VRRVAFQRERQPQPGRNNYDQKARQGQQALGGSPEPDRRQCRGLLRARHGRCICVRASGALGALHICLGKGWF